MTRGSEPAQDSPFDLFAQRPSLPRILVESTGDRRRSRANPPPPTRANRPTPHDWPPQVHGANGPPDAVADPDLHAVAASLLELDPTAARTAYVIRQAFDQIYDGRRTGRWDYTQLMKTEKTHIGTLVEIWMAREFRFDAGNDLDFLIAGVDVDCKWSRNLYQWEIPLEMYTRGDQIAMLMWGNEDTEKWALGLLRISEDVLAPPGRQRDRKRRLNQRGRDRILWVHRTGRMVPNTLLKHPKVALKVAAASTGQQAVDILFRELPGVLVNQVAVETAAQQIDSSKRVRDARLNLRCEGIVIFGHYAPHPTLAKTLDLPQPTLGWFISARLHPATDDETTPSITLQGRRWRLGRAGEADAEGPILPRQGTSLE